ncbi:Snf7-domain-containing protein [Suillus spraguei]|nr:Snf7-domain-containing protein [Suillus spraguei]
MGLSQSAPKVTAHDRAILECKKIQVVLDREHEIAKAHLATGQKDRAVIALRRRKYQQSLLLKTDSQLENLEQLVSTIEFSLVEVSVLHGLKQGNEVLREIHREMSIESVEKLMEETQEAREYQREIGDLLANRLTHDEEDAVQAELLALQGETLGQAGPEARLDLPSPPRSLPLVSEEAQQVPLETKRERVPVPG